MILRLDAFFKIVCRAAQDNRLAVAIPIPTGEIAVSATIDTPGLFSGRGEEVGVWLGRGQVGLLQSWPEFKIHVLK